MKTIARICLVLVGMFVLAVAAVASDVTIPNSFTAGTTASAAQVNANFAAVEAAVDDNDARLDAIQAGGVTSAYIAADTIVAADIATGGVATAEILDGTIATADIADSAVTSAKIADSTIASADIAADTITAADIATGAVASAEILDGTIVAADIAASTITAAKILDEPGIKNTPNTSGFVLTTGTNAVQNAHSIAINCPAAGYVVVLASCFVVNGHTVLAADELIRLSIETNTTGMSFLTNVGPGQADLPIGSYDYPATLHRVFTVSGAGSVTYYLNAQSYYGNVNASTWTVAWINMTAMYFPTTY